MGAEPGTAELEAPPWSAPAFQAGADRGSHAGLQGSRGPAAARETEAGHAPCAPTCHESQTENAPYRPPREWRPGLQLEESRRDYRRTPAPPSARQGHHEAGCHRDPGCAQCCRDPGTQWAPPGPTASSRPEEGPGVGAGRGLGEGEGVGGSPQFRGCVSRRSEAPPEDITAVPGPGLPPPGPTLPCGCQASAGPRSGQRCPRTRPLRVLTAHRAGKQDGPPTPLLGDPGLVHKSVPTSPCKCSRQREPPERAELTHTVRSSTSRRARATLL